MARMTTERPTSETMTQNVVRETPQRHMGLYHGWPSTVSGILSILSGAVGIALGIAAIAGSTVFTDIFGTLSTAPLIAGGITALVLGLIAIVGGAVSLTKMSWALALIGSIVSVVVFPLTGVLSLIFLAVGKKDFEIQTRRLGMAYWRPTRTSVSQLALCLKGIDFPANKHEMVESARSHDCPEETIVNMEKLPDRRYIRAEEVEQEFGTSS